MGTAKPREDVWPCVSHVVRWIVVPQRRLIVLRAQEVIMFAGEVPPAFGARS